MEERTGTCRFCGQRVMIDMSDDDILDAIREEEMDDVCIVDEFATRSCTCREAEEYKIKILARKECVENIHDMFDEAYPEIAQILEESVPAIMSGAVKTISISNGKDGTATLKRNGRKIGVKWTQKNSTEAEIYA